MKRVLSINEASKYVNLSPNYIRELIIKGSFPYINISKGNRPCYRFDIKELDKWIESKNNNSQITAEA